MSTTTTVPAEANVVFEQTTYAVRAYRDGKVFSNFGSYTNPVDALNAAQDDRVLDPGGVRNTYAFVRRVETHTEEEINVADFLALTRPPAPEPETAEPETARVEPVTTPEESETEGAWSGMFVGHWEDDEIVVEYVLPVGEQDLREDVGEWEQGLFAAPGYGKDYDDALAKVRAEYENQ